MVELGTNESPPEEGQVLFEQQFMQSIQGLDTNNGGVTFSQIEGIEPLDVDKNIAVHETIQESVPSNDSSNVALVGDGSELIQIQLKTPEVSKYVLVKMFCLIFWKKSLF